MKIVAISDTHGYHKGLRVPDGDMLIHAGDFSMRAKEGDVTEFAEWFKKLPHKHKIIVPGNHDCYCDGNKLLSRDIFSPVIYLDHEQTEVGGYKIFGSPYSACIYEPSPWSFDYVPDSDRSKRLWEQIPYGMDILITHGPPKGILDKVRSSRHGEDPNVGDVNLLLAVRNKIPRVHIFGHIHEGYGVYESSVWTTKFYNVCICDVNYQPTNPITIFEL